MEQLKTFYTILELSGIFAFAVSGAAAAKIRGLDIFGIFVIAFTVACGGGIIRDLCIGAIPPAGLTNWTYLVVSLVAALLTIRLYPLVERMNHPVLFFDAMGLALFAITGTQKTLAFGFNAQAAILLGITTAVGGGVLRDVLLNRVPVIFEKEIYASVALLGAVLVVAGNYIQWLSADMMTILALILCFSVRLLAMKKKWNLPVYKENL
jgi:uncharacterized membrane protein YeiH